MKFFLTSIIGLALLASCVPKPEVATSELFLARVVLLGESLEAGPVDQYTVVERLGAGHRRYRGAHWWGAVGDTILCREYKDNALIWRSSTE
jgi:hypothetical protein